MMTLEDKAVAWLKYAQSWLNQFGQSSLSDPALTLLERLGRDLERNESKKAWDVIEDLIRLSDTSEGLESAEILLHCGLVAARMGSHREAHKFLSASSSKFVHTHHQSAVAQWMKGSMEWLLPGKEVEAINSWRDAKKKFDAIKLGRESKKDEQVWYSIKCNEMQAALHHAAEIYAIPPLPVGADASGDGAGSEDAPASIGPKDLRVGRMGFFPYYESIRAGSFGPSGMLQMPAGNIEIEQVFIDDKPHRILSVNGSGYFRAPLSNTSIIKVTGDSMNKANIQSGDYVLMQLLPRSLQSFSDGNEHFNQSFMRSFNDGDIVAAEILADDGDSITLKRVYRRGERIVLRPQSTNPKWVEREFDSSDAGFMICGIVFGLLKPL